MTPKEKAKELVAKYHQLDFRLHTPANYQIAKECALIAVREIQDALSEYDNRNDTCELQNMDRDFNYWYKVEEELENL